MYRDSGLPVILLRCGDFIDTQKTMNWFEAFITKPLNKPLNKGLNKGRIDYPGDLEVPHAWAYLPDAARAAVMLAERRESLAGFADIPFEGFTLSGRQMADDIGRATGKQVTASRYRWWQLRLVQPFMPVIGGLFEMRYLWSLPQQLDGAELAKLLPDFTPTPPREALRQALAYRTGGAATGAAILA